MNFAQALTHLNAAAKDALQGIQGDRETAPQKLKPLLTYIESNLFHPDLRVGQLKKACGIRDNSISMQFHAALGLPPSSYIEKYRMGVASRLLQETEVPVSMIAELLGFSSLQVFSTAFNRWAGIRPNPYRDQHRTEAPQSEGGETEHGEGPQSVETLRKALMGSLPAREASALIHYLEDIYSTKAEQPSGWKPELKPLVSPGDSHGPLQLDPTRDRQRAEQLWQEMAEAAPEKQRQIVRANGRFLTPALFHLLRAKSRDEGRENRSRGMQLAELALESLVICEQTRLAFTDVPTEDVSFFANLRAQGWTAIAHARRLALDFAGAEQAFKLAEEQFPTDHRDRTIFAELFHLKAGLRWYQRRHREAIELENRAVPLLRLIGDPHPLAEALLLRASVHHSVGDYPACFPDLHEAMQLIDERQSPYLAFSAYQILADAYTRSGMTQQATTILPKIQNLVHGLNGSGDNLHVYVSWLEGLISRGQGQTEQAEAQLGEARKGFSVLGDGAHSAMVSLDLATLYAEQQRATEALTLATEIVPLFVALQNFQAAGSALRILREMIASRQVSTELLQAVRIHLDQIPKEPVARMK